MEPRSENTKFEYEQNEGESSQDLSEGKGCLMKRTEVVGEQNGMCPTYDSIVKVNYSVKTTDGTLLSKKNNAEFVIGSANVAEALELAVLSMKKGEKANITASPEYGYPEGEPADNIPPNSNLLFQIELLDFKKEEPQLLLTPDEKLEGALKKKEQGNQLFQRSKFKHAERKYNEIIEMLKEDHEFNFEEKGSQNAMQAMKLSSYLNAAASQLKLKKYKEALQNCDKALVIDSQNPKAFFRRGQAYFGIDEWDEALKDFAKASEIDPSSSKSTRQEIIKVKNKIKKQNQKDKKFYSRMFEKLQEEENAGFIERFVTSLLKSGTSSEHLKLFNGIFIALFALILILFFFQSEISIHVYVFLTLTVIVFVSVQWFLVNVQNI